MAICPQCQSSEIEYDAALGNSVCISCGLVVEENAVVAEVSFTERGNGTSVLDGQFISAERGKTALPLIFKRRVGDPSARTNATTTAARGDAAKSQAASSATGGATLADDEETDAGKTAVNLESREVTLANGRRRIAALAGAVGLTGEHYVDASFRWYQLALNHQFTRGRRGHNVIAACLYIVCRQEKTPHMLLDFSDVLSTSVYSLGGTFLRLVRLLNLEIPIVDPSFFVSRFAARLDFSERTLAVANTAVRVVARMKRDWIQTGRRPAGVCAAGLIIAARLHGFRRTESEVVRVVRICEATLRRRLEEFGRTPSSQLTPQEFEGIWLEQEADPPAFTHGRVRQVKSRHESSSKKAASAVAIEPAVRVVQSAESIPFDDASWRELDVDGELETMLLDAEEVELKTMLWSELNQDYISKEEERERAREREHAESEAALQAMGAAEKSTDPAKGGKRNSTVRKKRTLSKKARADVNEELPAAATAVDAARSVLQTRRLSKKINYAALDQLFTAKR